MTMDYDCDNPVFGQTNNPWSRERVPGGSSGGEAAALAVGMSPLGMGSDFRGSIRVPAHFCGIVGLKPTWGTIPGSGHMAPSVAAPPPIAHMATIGPMARFVDDLTLAYNVVKGPHPSTPYTVPTADAHPEKIDLKKVRCAIFTDACNVPVSSDIRAAIERAGRELQKMGIVVEAVKPPIDDGERLWWEYSGADGNQTMVAALGEALKLSRDRLRNFAVAGEGKSAAEFFKIAMERDAWRVQLAEFMERYPIILGPTFCVTAFKHGATEVDIDGKKFPHFLAGWPVAWGNCAGLPGLVVPCGKDREGLPIGLQINGRAFGEETVLAVAKAAETALGGISGRRCERSASGKNTILCETRRGFHASLGRSDPASSNKKLDREAGGAAEDCCACCCQPGLCDGGVLGQRLDVAHASLERRAVVRRCAAACFVTRIHHRGAGVDRPRDCGHHRRASFD